MLPLLKLMIYTFLNFLYKQLEQAITKNYGFQQKNWKISIGILLEKFILFSSPNFNTSNTVVDSLPKGTTVESIVCLVR